jgi:glycosyltransferase involved in cell wall biosynthesis
VRGMRLSDNPSNGSRGQIRVLYISPVADRGGAEVVLLNILKYHDRQSFTPMVCLLKEGPLVGDVRRLGVKCFVIATGRFRHLVRTVRTVWRIRRIMRHQCIDLVFSNMAMGHLYGGLAALGTQVKRVWFQHTISSGEAFDWLAAVVPADRLYVNSQACLRAVRGLRPRATRVHLIYPGTDTRSPTSNSGKSMSLRRDFCIPEEAPVIAMIGRFQRGKGQRVFIEAATAVTRHRPNARFVVVGDTTLGLEPSYKAELATLVARYGLSPSVIFTGWRDDVPTLLNEVDILVHPATAPESFGLVLVEALFQRKPVVASRQNGLMEIVTDGETGFLVPPGDAMAFADKILLLLGDEGLRRRMGERGREVVLERFTMARMIAELERSYLEVVSGQRGVVQKADERIL